MKTLKNLRIFAKTIELGSLSAAGRALALSPATISRHLDRLEKSVGVSLINRNSRKLAPSPTGILFYDKVSAILSQVESLDDIAGEQRTEVSGTLTVHSRISVADHFLHAILPQFLAQYPRLTVSVLLTEESLDVYDNKIDVALRLGNLDEPSLIVRKLTSGLERITAASPAYLAARSPIVEATDLAEHNCLAFPYVGADVWRFRKGKKTTTVKIGGNLQANYHTTLLEAALAGTGIVMLPIWTMGPHLKAGRLVRVLGDYAATPTTFDHGLYAVMHHAPQVPQKVRVFIDFLVEKFRAYEAEFATFK